MACNLEDGEAGSGWILSISGRVPTIPIYPRIIARQENMETSVPSEPSIGHDICPEIYHPTPAHIMAHITSWLTGAAKIPKTAPPFRSETLPSRKR